ncbi:MAG: hypothetical protein JW751_27990 [Polyangiaceae bacterium]|nr:hypothetical protein [Polyangiaceae bacterium]
MVIRPAVATATLLTTVISLFAGPVAAAEEEEDQAPEKTAVDRALDPNSPEEESGRNYYFVGMRYRSMIAPAFIQRWFADGGRTVLVHGVGPEFISRRDHMELALSPWYASYRMKETPFKAKDDPDSAWEIVESKLKVIYLTVDINWSLDVSEMVAINLGLGAGFGFLFGKLHRNQAYPAGATDPENYEKCPSEFFHPWCDNDNDHYGDYDEKSWANGGDKPMVYPWIVFPQVGVRVKPHRHFAAHFDTGFGTSGFFLGLGADYGI